MIRLIALAAVLLVLEFAAYAPGLEGGPVWDDHLLLEENPTIQGRTSLSEAFLQPFSPFPIYYRPVTALAIRAGVSPGPHPDLRVLHLAALLLHLSVALSLVLLARWAGADDLTATLAAGLFLLHPALSEAVAWMSGLGDLLAAACLTAAAALLLRVADSTGPSRGVTPKTVLASLLLAVALFSKETALLVPPLVWVALWRSSRGAPGRRKILVGSALGSAIALLLYAVLRVHAVPPGLNRSAGLGLESLDLEKAAVLLGSYTRRLVFPTALDLHPVVDLPSGFDIRYLWAGGALVGILSLTIWAARARPRALFGLGWIVVTGAPTWLFIPASSPVFAERYLYLPAIGLALVLPVLATDVSRRWLPTVGRTRIAVLALGAGLGLAALLLTRARTSDWASEETILDRALTRDPRNLALAVNRGFLLRTSGRTPEARQLYERTIRAVETGAPFYWTEHGRTAWTRILFEAGTMALEAGREDEGERDFRRALETDPTHEATLASLGALLGNRGRLAEAVELLGPGVHANPGSILLRGNLAKALLLLGRAKEAGQQYRAILALDPDNAEARGRLEQLGERP